MPGLPSLATVSEPFGYGRSGVNLYHLCYSRLRVCTFIYDGDWTKHTNPRYLYARTYAPATYSACKVPANTSDAHRTPTR